MPGYPRSSSIIRVIGDERGATALEYGLVLALITLASMGALYEMAGTVVGTWADVAAKVTGAS